jgi:hypothetical protein
MPLCSDRVPTVEGCGVGGGDTAATLTNRSRLRSSRQEVPSPQRIRRITLLMFSRAR